MSAARGDLKVVTFSESARLRTIHGPRLVSLTRAACSTHSVTRSSVQPGRAGYMRRLAMH